MLLTGAKRGGLVFPPQGNGELKYQKLSINGTEGLKWQNFVFPPIDLKNFEKGMQKAEKSFREFAGVTNMP